MSDFADLATRAHLAGMEAGNAAAPVPMVVGSPSTVFGNDIDPRQPSYFVADGVCGFAWVKFKGSTPFGRWAKKIGIARASYPKGMQINVRAFGQSMQRKEAYAQAYAKVLQDAGVEAYADSRMD